MLCIFLGCTLTGCGYAKYNYFTVTDNPTESDNYLSESREITPFNDIDLTIVGEVFFTQSDEYTLKIEGNKDFVKRHKSKVENGKLIISIDTEYNKGNKNGVTIHISAPEFQQLEFDGVGSFTCNEPLKLKNVDFDYSGVGTLYIKDLKCKQLTANINGVGEAEINVNCQNLIAEINGIGSLTLKGTTQHAKINRNGIATINTTLLTTTE